jgi:hypothetical protein
VAENSVDESARGSVKELTFCVLLSGVAPTRQTTTHQAARDTYAEWKSEREASFLSLLALGCFYFLPFPHAALSTAYPRLLPLRVWCCC